jgi:hypothetical protein
MGEKRTRELWQDGIYSSRYSRKVLKNYLELKEGKKERRGKQCQVI